MSPRVVDAGVIAVDTTCLRCGRPLVLHCSMGPSYHEDQWWCPHPDCGAVHHVDVRGIIVTAVTTEDKTDP